MTSLLSSRPTVAAPLRDARRATSKNYPTATLASWQLDGILGEGTLGRVFRAKPISATTTQPAAYALKLLHDRWENHPLAIERLRWEAKVGRAVYQPNLISVLDAHTSQSPYLVVLPLLGGQTVAQRIAQSGALNPVVALWIARQAAAAMSALHAAGFIHGDVKPGNLQLAADGHVTLFDLDCARPYRQQATFDDHPLLGTPHYWAPELISGAPATPRSDLYSLGITLFEILCGRLPLATNDLAELAAAKRVGALPNVRAFAPQVPNEIAELVRFLTARTPERRPHDAVEVLERIAALEIKLLPLRWRE